MSGPIGYFHPDTDAIVCVPCAKDLTGGAVSGFGPGHDATGSYWSAIYRDSYAKAEAELCDHCGRKLGDQH